MVVGPRLVGLPGVLKTRRFGYDGKGQAMIRPDTDPAAAWDSLGRALVTRGETGGVEVLHVSRHEEGHRRLSNHVAHRANIAALKLLGADAVVAVTVCGAVDPTVPLGSLVVFDDLHFLANRLADGSLNMAASHAGTTYRTAARIRVALSRFVIGHTLPRGSHVKRVWLDGRRTGYRTRATNRGLEVLVRAPASGRHVLVVETR